jgi:hypothetical protein
MSNVVTPPPENLPSSRSLRRATVIGIIVAILLVVIVILPAERGIDITGIGKVIGVKEMGEFKIENHKEFAEAAAIRAQRKADSLAGRTRGSSSMRDSTAATDSTHAAGLKKSASAQTP